MGAPKGNRFWELASKHGRDKLFASPELLWEAACEYFKWCVDNPLVSIEQARGGSTKKDVEVSEKGLREVDTGLVELPKMRAFTWQGLARYVHVDVKTLRDYGSLISHKDFHPVITRMGEVIYQQKFEGASAGFLNANIIARDLGLVDKQDVVKSRKITVTRNKNED